MQVENGPSTSQSSENIDDLSELTNRSSAIDPADYFKNKDIVNIRKKIEILLLLKNMTIAGLSREVPQLPYQTLYRIQNQPDYLPSIKSLKIIANYFEAPIDKFISPYLTIKIECYNSLTHYNDKISSIMSLDLRLDYIESYSTLDYFAIDTQLNIIAPITYNCNGINTTINSNYVSLFYKIDKFTSEGYYLCEITYDDNKRKLQVINVVSINTITAVISDVKSNSFVTFELSKIKVLAKYILPVPITEEHPAAICYKSVVPAIDISPGEITISK